MSDLLANLGEREEVVVGNCIVLVVLLGSQRALALAADDWSDPFVIRNDQEVNLVADFLCVHVLIGLHVDVVVTHAWKI